MPWDTWFANWPDWLVRKLIFGNTLLAWLAALCILILAFLLRKPLGRLIQLMLRPIRWRGKKLGERFGDLLAPGFSWLFLTVGLTLAFLGVLNFSDPARRLIDRVLITLVVVTLFQFVHGIGRAIINSGRVRAQLTGGHVTQTMYGFYVGLIRVVTLLVGAVMILRIWGLDITGLITGLGIGGLAISLAAKDTLSNLLAGVIIMNDRAFDVGHHIRTPDIEGVVEEIGYRSSRIRSFDQALVTVPNAKLAESYVTNVSEMGKRRIRFHLALSYEIATEQVLALQEALRHYLAGRPTVLQDQILLSADAIADQSLYMTVQFFLKDLDFSHFQSEQQGVMLEIWRLLDTLDIRSQPLEVRIIQDQQGELNYDDDSTG